VPLADGPLGAVHRAVAPRVVAALAARFRDLDLAEEGYAEALAKAAARWSDGAPANPEGWLYRTAERAILDRLRRRAVRQRHAAAEQPLLHEEEEEDETMLDTALIPDERLRLIFVCCHPALSDEARIALTLKTVCRLGTVEIARAFLVPEPTVAQRLVRAKRKIAEAGVPFEVPGPQLWAERLEAVLATIEIAYAQAHEDGAGSGRHAGFGPEMLGLTRLLAELLPDEHEVLALAATIHFAEARRPARIDPAGAMVPLAEQDPDEWDRVLIARGDALLRRGFALRSESVRLLKAGIHAAWCRRRSLAEPAPWSKVLALYDGLLRLRDDPFVRLNRAVALAEVASPDAALAEVAALDEERMEAYLPYHAVKADLLRRTGETALAAEAYAAALALAPPVAEAAWLRGRLVECT